MADKDTSAPRDGGERRQIPPSETEGRRQAPTQGGGYGTRPQTPPRSSSGYSERRPASPQSGGYSGARQQPPTRSGYGERRPTSTQSGGYSGSRSYSERQPSSPRSSGSYSSARQPSSSSSRGGSAGYGERRSSSRRTDVIRCENCGEDYSITYKRCPFCDERPGRGGGSGRRVANTRGGGYGRPVNPIQVAGLAISVLLILTAIFIVVRFIGKPLFGGNKPGTGSSVSTSQSQSTGSQSTPKPQAVQSISLSESAVTLDSGATHQLTASLLPVSAAGSVVWSSSDPTAASVDATGLVTNLNSGSDDVTVTITASCGTVQAEAAVTCKGSGATVPSGPVTSGTQGIINASGGLNIRSGPGTTYSVVASAANGATVTILGEENGWYQIRYSGSNTGYVSKDYVFVR